MIKVGITGGIGSGKTLISSIFEKLGIPVYNADNRAKWLQNYSPELIEAIKKEFGEDIYSINGLLNREKLASLIFNNKNCLQTINSLVHPAVEKDYYQWIDKYKNLKITAKEAAILFESGAYRQVDFIVTVCAPVEIRIKRIRMRDQLPEEKIRQRINNQLGDDEKILRSDFVIYNDDIQPVMPQILLLMKNLDAKIGKISYE